MLKISLATFRPLLLPHNPSNPIDVAVFRILVFMASSHEVGPSLWLRGVPEIGHVISSGFDCGDVMWPDQQRSLVGLGSAQ